MNTGPWRMLFGLARPFRARILIIILLAALSTAATLIEPLIYRVAVNDVAGLFVRKAQEQTDQPQEDTGSPEGTESSVARLEPVAFQSREPRINPHRQIESTFIQGVFGHVLRLPLAFFGKRAKQPPPICCCDCTSRYREQS
jgi:hypothetical protein